MSSLTSQPGRQMLDGTTRLLLAQALLIPTGILSAAFLARHLSPTGYGLFTLAATLVAWIEWIIPSMFSRAVTKFIGEAEDCQAISTVVLRLYLIAGVVAGVLLWLLAHTIALLFNEPALAHYLQLFAIDIPLFSLACAHRSILTGTGNFRPLSLATASRWISRLLLLVLLVELGFSVTGAVLGSIGASLVELAIVRFYIRPSLFRRSNFPVRQLCAFALPLFLVALSMRLFDKLDLFMLKALGGTAEEAGFYGAAQNLSLVPCLFALSFSPLLLSTLARTLRDGDDHLAKTLSRDAMRIVLWLLPFAGMTAGASAEIVRAIFGAAFLPASTPLALLLFGSLGLIMLSVATAILTAADKPGWTFALTGPLPLMAAAGHLLLIPRLGVVGASLVTTLVASLGALTAVMAVYHHWRILPPAATVWRSLLVGALAYVLSVIWPASDLWLLLKLPAITFVILLVFMLLGEFSASEIALARSTPWRWRTPSEQTPREV